MSRLCIKKKGLTWPCEGCQVRPFGASRLATARNGKLLRHTLALLCEDAARLGRLGGRLLREVADVRDVPCWTREKECTRRAKSMWMSEWLASDLNQTA